MTQREVAVHALEQMIVRARRLEIDLAKVAVVSDGFGALGVTALARLAKDGAMPLAVQVLFYPVTDDRVHDILMLNDIAKAAAAQSAFHQSLRRLKTAQPTETSAEQVPQERVVSKSIR